jgi:two-component system, LytTR family, response regulator
MRCVLIDDEPKALEILRKYVERVHFLDLAGTFRDPVRALQYMAESPVDLIFLDINMPDMSGIQFLNALHTQPLVIFTTAYSDYAVRSYDYDAVDYLLKPIEFERFMRAVSKALEFHRQREQSGPGRHANEAAAQDGSGNYLVVKSGTDYHKLQIDEILYIEAAGNYAVFVTSKANVMSLLSMKELGSLLPLGRFFRIHKSYIVNFRHVSKIERDQVTVGTKLIPIGEAFRESFLKAIQLTK